MNNPEHQHQKALIDWAHINKRQYPWLLYLIAVPNGGHRRPAVAGKLKAEGVKAGVSDLFLAYPKGAYSGVWIEMKAPRSQGGKAPSRAQLEWLEAMRKNGYAAAVCYGWDDAREVLLAYSCGQFPTPNQALPVRLSEKISTVNDKGCWVWAAATVHGYGYVHFEGKQQRAHRVIYRILRGPIPEGLELDHLCRNPACVNPDHLEPVTPRENVARSESPAAKNLRKTHCLRGHEFTPSNIYRQPDRPRSRNCRTCRLAVARGRDQSYRHREYQRRKLKLAEKKAQ
jgi:HNH endonuclease/VRR-NUC domain